MPIVIKTPQEIEKMRIAGRLAAELLDYIGPFVKVGVTTNELDKLCHEYTVNVLQATSAPLNYAPFGHPAPIQKSICTSVNHQVCHGVPGDKKLKNGDIGHAIQKHAEAQGLSVVREFCGHGIGREFHEEPQVLHYGKPGAGIELVPGMIFTVEPMLNAGRRDIRQLGDGWTIVTKDHSLSAQWERTILVTETAYEVLTMSATTPPKPDSIS